MSVTINGVEVGRCPECGSGKIGFNSESVVCRECDHAQPMPQEMRGAVSTDSTSTIVVDGDSTSAAVRDARERGAAMKARADAMLAQMEKAWKR